MRLQAGEHLGPYEIVAPLGAGGMGEVYRARDTKLDREVAIKVLPETFAGDPERVARFQREAKVLASLNHPNIAAIHGFEESDETRFLVLELVEGETLADRLRAGSLPVDEALEVSKQITDGLEAAHEHGVIHRDLKPANVKVTPDGLVKVLDFGLAKAFAGDMSATEIAQSPTITVEHTRPGVVLGTAAYMSPEQARGKPLDKRTDIWSFGCVLFECLTGRRPFEGETTSDVLARILERDPDLERLPHNTPHAIRNLLHHCLQKDRKRRLHDIGDAGIELDDAISTRAWSTSAIAAVGPVAAYERRTARPILVAALLLVLGGVAGITLWGLIRPTESRPPPPVSRVSIDFPAQMQVLSWDISPDGKTLAWIARLKSDGGASEAERRIYARPLDAYQVDPVRGTEGADRFKFSPDSRWLTFSAPISPGASQRRLARVPVDSSSPPLTLADWQDKWSSWTLLPSGDILILTELGHSFVRVPGEGGRATQPREIELGGFVGSLWAGRALPDGRAVFLGSESWGSGGYQGGALLLNLETGTARMMFATGGKAVYSPTGHVLFSRGETLLAAPFDLAELVLRGGPVTVTGGIRTPFVGGHGWFTVSANGMLVYAAGGQAGMQRRIVMVDEAGNVEPWSEERRAFNRGMRVSLDGRKLAAVVIAPNGKYEVWTSEVDRPRLRQLAAVADADCWLPIWSPDGERVAYLRNARNEHDGIYWCRADRSGAPERLLKREASDTWLTPLSWSPDGAQLLIRRFSAGKTEVLVLPVEADEHGVRRPKTLSGTPSIEWFAEFSPDGKWIAYTSDDSGRREVYVCPYNDDGTTGAGIPISTDGGRGSRWAADGKTLFYRAGPNRVMGASITTEPAFNVSTPRQVFDLDQLRALGSGDFLPDGRYIMIQKGEDEDDIKGVNVVLNWFEELKAKVPTETGR
jgi:serine/threonine-protein kinase